MPNQSTNPLHVHDGRMCGPIHCTVPAVALSGGQLVQQQYAAPGMQRQYVAPIIQQQSATVGQRVFLMGQPNQPPMPQQWLFGQQQPVVQRTMSGVNCVAASFQAASIAPALPVHQPPLAAPRPRTAVQLARLNQQSGQTALDVFFDAIYTEGQRLQEDLVKKMVQVASAGGDPEIVVAREAMQRTAEMAQRLQVTLQPTVQRIWSEYDRDGDQLLSGPECRALVDDIIRLNRINAGRIVPGILRSGMDIAIAITEVEIRREGKGDADVENMKLKIQETLQAQMPAVQAASNARIASLEANLDVVVERMQMMLKARAPGGPVTRQDFCSLFYRAYNTLFNMAKIMGGDAPICQNPVVGNAEAGWQDPLVIQ